MTNFFKQFHLCVELLVVNFHEPTISAGPIVVACFDGFDCNRNTIDLAPVYQTTTATPNLEFLRELPGCCSDYGILELINCIIEPVSSPSTCNALQTNSRSHQFKKLLHKNSQRQGGGGMSNKPYLLTLER